MLTTLCVLVMSSSDVPILLGLRKTANASPYQNLDSCQPATILCNSSIYFFLLTCFLFGEFSWVVTAQSFFHLPKRGHFQEPPDTCMRNELSCMKSVDLCVRTVFLASFLVSLSLSLLFLFCL
jgi:hypothetical protein